VEKIRPSEIWAVKNNREVPGDLLPVVNFSKDQISTTWPYITLHLRVHHLHD